MTCALGQYSCAARVHGPPSSGASAKLPSSVSAGGAAVRVVPDLLAAARVPARSASFLQLAPASRRRRACRRVCVGGHQRAYAAAGAARAVRGRRRHYNALERDCAAAYHRRLPAAAQGGRRRRRRGAPCRHDHRQLLVRAQPAGAPHDQGAPRPRHAGHRPAGRAHDRRARAAEPSRGVGACGAPGAAGWRGPARRAGPEAAAEAQRVAARRAGAR